MNDSRGEAAHLIRDDWWGGKLSELQTRHSWDMGNELSIWNKLVTHDSPELVNGAMSVLFKVAPDLERPVTLRIFYAAATTPLYEQCKALWISSHDSEVSLPTLRKVPDARDEHQRRQTARTDALRRLAVAKREAS